MDGVRHDRRPAAVPRANGDVRGDTGPTCGPPEDAAGAQRGGEGNQPKDHPPESNDVEHPASLASISKPTSTTSRRKDAGVDGAKSLQSIFPSVGAEAVTSDVDLASGAPIRSSACSSSTAALDPLRPRKGDSVRPRHGVRHQPVRVRLDPRRRGRREFAGRRWHEGHDHSPCRGPEHVGRRHGRTQQADGGLVAGEGSPEPHRQGVGDLHRHDRRLAAWRRGHRDARQARRSGRRAREVQGSRRGAPAEDDGLDHGARAGVLPQSADRVRRGGGDRGLRRGRPRDTGVQTRSTRSTCKR